ncbi:MAG: ribosome small subunit-dependent GTPase A [Gemmatimonadetes bacterium]|nr:ribosome small subunit-dependent GTPase A [Gemmatimonadota bacterium]MBT8477660.1 ribosome small subunit-dependent GTPase A [Gemmatimonadota bacterium]NNK48161.1 ribosome small subunit-dependent GTPase A [Gemmatimonadota bacterium]
MPDSLTGRVLQFTAGVYRIHTPGGTYDCSLRGRAKRDAGERVVVGDLVTLEQLEDGSCRITEVLPRHSRLSRHSMAKRREQVLAANVDQVAAVFSLARPEPDVRLLDRLLAVAELHDLPAVIVMNKADLAGDVGVPPEIAAYSEIGYPVLCTCATTGAGIPDLQERLAGRITVFTGPSGVGKSSILNAIMPELDLRVGTVGEKTGKGKHTTSAGLLIPLTDGGYLADTPGIQYFEPAGVDPADLAHAFREFRPLVEHCRFADCRHRAEPGCAVIEAVTDGSIAEHRHVSYLSLLEAAEEARG